MKFPDSRRWSSRSLARTRASTTCIKASRLAFREHREQHAPRYTHSVCSSIERFRLAFRPALIAIVFLRNADDARVADAGCAIAYTVPSNTSPPIALRNRVYGRMYTCTYLVPLSSFIGKNTILSREASRELNQQRFPAIDRDCESFAEELGLLG